MKFDLLSILTTLFVVASTLKAVDQAEPATAPATEAAPESAAPADAAAKKEGKEEGSSGEAAGMDFKLDEDMMKQLREMFGDDIDFDDLFGDEDDNAEKADL
jgi:hypothetical protein